MATIRLGSIDSAQLTPDRELALISAAMADDFGAQMRRLMTIRVETGSAVDHSENVEATIVEERMLGDLGTP